ncbi:MAG TPA: hypothetical protein VGF32_14790, partial [Streptosporangiaceae bacterium]
MPHARWSRRLALAAMGAAALVVVQMASGLSVGFTAPLSALAAGPAPTGHPNRFAGGPAMQSVNHLPPPPTATGPKPTYTQPRALPVSMQPALVPLDPVSGAHVVASDGVLELTVPAGAVTAADVRAAGGALNLLVRQVMPASGSNAGDWGKYTFGTWVAQVVDAGGHPASRGLRQKVGVELHQDRRASALDLVHTQVLVNPALPSWVDLNPASVPVRSAGAASAARQAQPAAPPTGTAKPALGPASRQAAALDSATTTLSATVPMSAATTSFSFNSTAPVATFGRPDPFETDLSAGALSAGIQLDLPQGPGGLTPPVQLAYNSASVSDQHNPQGAAPWVGEGWNVSLGAISWAERNLHTVNPTNPPVWEDSWQLSDPYGTGADLIPPATTTSTYNDDTTNGITPSPVTWHTSPETRAKVISFTSPAPPAGMSPTPPCFRVFLRNGVMEEFGCTADSLQYYPQPTGARAGLNFVANWLLDLITDPQGNQIHLTYQRDMETTSGISYPRDAVLSTVEYDSPTCHDAQNMCTGSSWAPLMRVNFAAGHSVSHVSGSSCAANGSLRCDDPVDESGSGGVAAPLIQSTFVLNDAQVQVRAGGSAGWSTLRDYQFSYDQGAPGTLAQEPVSGAQESTAGRLLLKSLQVIGADAATALPSRTFGYTSLPEWYEDVTKSPVPATNCGAPWNNGVKPNINLGCVRWSTT